MKGSGVDNWLRGRTSEGHFSVGVLGCIVYGGWGGNLMIVMSIKCQAAVVQDFPIPESQDFGMKSKPSVFTVKAKDAPRVW